MTTSRDRSGSGFGDPMGREFREADVARLLIDRRDAGECGWSTEFARMCFDRILLGRDVVPAREALTLARSPRDLAAATAAAGGPRAEQRAIVELFPGLVTELLAYRRERAAIVRRYSPIRFTKVNLKRVGLGDFSPALLRRLALDLGCRVREDEEGVTVAVEDLLPFFRRPVIRRVLDRKLVMCGIATTETPN